MGKVNTADAGLDTVLEISGVLREKGVNSRLTLPHGQIKIIFISE